MRAMLGRHARCERGNSSSQAPVCAPTTSLPARCAGLRQQRSKRSRPCRALPNAVELSSQPLQKETAGWSTRPSTLGSNGAAREDDVLLELRDVHKSFGSKEVLRGASFKIRRGEAVGIIGGSGTGKSTALRLLAGLIAPDKGEVLVQGVPRSGLVTDHVPGDGELKVGLVFQSGALFDSLTVGENVGFLLYEHTKMAHARIRELVADCLAQVGLRGVEDLYPAELSGGMKKRVALARAIIQDEDHLGAEQVIMYDEPTAGLDPVASTIVEDLIRALPAGGEAAPPPGSGNGAHAQQQGGLNVAAYVVVTHQHSTIRRAVDRLVFLHEGRVVWQGSVEEFDSSSEPIVRQFSSGSLQGPLSYT